MPDVLKDLSPKALAAAIEESSYEFWLDYGKGPGGEIHDEPDVLWFVSGKRHSLLNGVMRCRFHPEDADRRVREMMEEFRRRGLPLEWNLGYGSEPRDLGRVLAANGFEHPLDIEGMALDLDRFLDEPPPEGLTIDFATSRADVETFLRIGGANFDIPEEDRRELVDLESSLGPTHEARLRRYLGRWNGKPVATCQLFEGAGVAGIYYVTTLPGARGHGIAAAMTRAALRDGKGMGYRAAVLQASPMGQPIYRRLGFQGFFTIELYTWSPTPTVRKVRIPVRRKSRA